MSPFKLKLVVSIILVLVGASLGIALTKDTVHEANDSFTIDFGDYRVDNVSAVGNSNASEALMSACSRLGYVIEHNPDGSVKSIDGMPSGDDGRRWGLFTQGWDGTKCVWTEYKGDPTSLKVSDAGSMSWGLCSKGDVPAPTFDATGKSFYGLKEAKTIVCLAPSVTETVCELGYENRIIGTDRYSNYPESIQQKRDMGIITETGSYTSPNFEIIVKLNPDIVIGISSQNGHLKIAEKLNAVGITTIITSDGEDLKTVYDNTLMCGVAVGDKAKAEEVTNKLRLEVGMTQTIVSHTADRPSIMVALSPEKSPWVAGMDTYVSDIYSKAGAVNAFDKSKNPSLVEMVEGWKQINPESIVQGNPAVIIVISSFGTSQETYDKMIAELPAEWKSTDAYHNGKIYLVGDSAGDMMSRPSTRLAQLTEFIGRMVHEDAFPEVISIPKIVGSEYTDYLTYSKTL
ncbi:MAG: helical backbone metal receptor [archaeon]|nr:helical backbone metal receptor [archaeon]